MRGLAILVLIVGLVVTACDARNPPSSSSNAASAGTGIGCPTRGAFDGGSVYYAQFYEDYILAYVFKGLKNGVYVDVGANDPNDHSVTKYLYLSGWRGVNIEPNPDMLALLEKARPEDVNLGIGISDSAASLTFYRFKSVSGLSTFDRDIALRHKNAGVDFEEMQIPVSRLDDVLEGNERVRNGFTFMNVDVEGFEPRVFAGANLKQHPATVLMVEATAPETEHATYQSWEPLLFSVGYIFAMDDGLNRFYVHPDHRDLLAKFVEVNYCVQMDKLAKGIKLNGYLDEHRH